MTKNSELKALVSLLDDNDAEVLQHVTNKILSLGMPIIPFLEQERQEISDKNAQNRIENIIQKLQFKSIKEDLAEWKENNQEELLEALWIITRLRYPNTELKKLRKSIDEIFYEAWLSHRNYATPLEQLRNLNEIFFKRYHFIRNDEEPLNPDNSMLSWVFQTKKSNPIGLCVIYMLVAQKLRMPIYGVNFPNIFVLTYKNEETQFYINVFEGGLIFSKQDIDEYLPKINIEPQKKFYIPCDNIEIIKRILRNLIMAYENSEEIDKKEEVKILLDLLEQ
jgi:regulator of sirC expression with transglutaminase-like and TPR domain